MRKFIIVDGKKVYLQEEKDGEEGSVTPEDGVTPPATPADDEDADKEAAEAAKSISKMVRKELGIDDLKKTIEEARNVLNRPENSKLREIMHGKDIANKDQLTKEEKIIGFFHALVTRNETVVKALSETAADGGNLFPAEFLAELVRTLTEPGSMRSLVRVIPMRRNTMTYPTLTNRPKVYWTAENAAKTTTTANFGTGTLTAKKAAAIIYASDELVEDSTEFGVVQLIIDLFAEAIQAEENRVILRGNGTTEPQGISAAVTASTIASIASSGNLSGDNLLNLTYALPSMYRSGASYLVHPENIAELRKIKDTTGQYVWAPGLTAGQPNTILGYPVYEFYDMPSTAIYFGNWKLAYWLGDRQQMTVKVSNDTETAFTHDQTAIRVVFRIAGAVVLGAAAKALTSIP